jgi:hypothetical protein
MVDATGLNRANITSGGSLGGGGGVYTTDVPAARKATLTLFVDMAGAADADLAVVATPYDLGGNLINSPLPAVLSAGPKFAGGKVTYYAQFDVSGVDRVQIKVTNNNAGAQVLNRVSWVLTGEDD